MAKLFFPKAVIKPPIVATVCGFSDSETDVIHSTEAKTEDVKLALLDKLLYFCGTS